MANHLLRTKKTPNRSIRTPANREKILELLATGKAVTLLEAAKKCGFSVRSLHEWKEADPDFHAEIVKALEMGVDPLEELLYSHAIKGVPKNIYYEGEVVDTIIEYDHGLGVRLLDRRRPVAQKTELEVGKSLEQLLSEVNKADRHPKATAEKKPQKKERKPHL